jgi:hypothetical protein
MRIAVLGPLEVLTDASVPVPVPGETERLLLAVLTAGAPGEVATGELLGAVPDDVAPEAARESLLAHLGCLRGSLEPNLRERSTGQYVLRRGRGYALAVGRSNVDALRFGDLVQRGRAQLAAGDPAEAARLLSTALGLWRGEPYAEWPDAPFAAAERRRLHALRAQAEAALNEARSSVPAHPRVPAALPVTWLSPPRPAGPAARSDPQPEPEPLRKPTGGPPATTEATETATEATETAAATEATETATGTAAATDGPPERRIPFSGRRPGRRLVLSAVLVVALGVTALAVRSQQQATQAAAAADGATEASVVDEANRLAALAPTVGSLDTSLLLSVRAYRLAETPQTRAGLQAAVAALGRVQRVLAIRGVPQDPFLTGGGRTLTYGIGTAVVAWPMGSPMVPHVIMDIPGAWGDWVTAAPSPTEDELMAAGVKDGVPWLRMVSTGGDSRMLLQGNQIDGWPLDGAVSADGTRILLVLAKPDSDAPNTSSDWELLDVAVADGSTRDTGVHGTFHAPLGFLAADFADDAGSFVLWDSQGLAATLVDLSDGRAVPVTPHSRPAVLTTFRALPSGAAQLWDDGTVTLVGADGGIEQELDVHEQQVRDVVVAPDGRWAVTAGNGGEVRRWSVDPTTGHWFDPEPLPGHRGDVVGADVDAAGRTLFTVGLDSTVITWDMSGSSGIGDNGASRQFTHPQAWLDKACAVVERDLSSGEWTRYLPDMLWEPTCSDLS